MLEPERGSSSEAGILSSGFSHVRQEEVDGGHFPPRNPFRHSELEEERRELEEQRIATSYRRDFTVLGDNENVREDTWSCVIVLLTFWFFISMTIILGVYGSVNVQLGPNCSLLLQPNCIFVQSMKLEELNGSKPGPMVYGFHKPPPLDVVKIWSETYKLSISMDSYKDLMYNLNVGSQINISYTVNSPSSSIILIIAEGNEGLTRWLENPTHVNSTLSWNIIHGSGMISQGISKSSSYYVAAGNLNSEDVEVKLKIRIRASQYDTSEAYYKCNISEGPCSMQILFPEGNAAVLTNLGPDQVAAGPKLYVKLTYGPRWATYIVGIGSMTMLMLFLFNFLDKCHSTRDGTGGHNEVIQPERHPLLSNKDDDLSSWGSSYESVSQDEEDLAIGSIEGKSIEDGENSNNTRRLCAICFDAPRDCFFLPCGHCVACFECGTRISEAEGTCPICRRKMKKVRKIFTV
ncbi:E3 ubiquitin-protein ligase APD2 [Cannabis sativa]|uniref:RING-type domain-containing protein n=2 Tax=Cannabis sativa TaxID=3483 RepID=A0A803QFU9_CANSA|nr:E3 ubiquitin-protein ligase APD2 [Cannabis sativa]XP_030480387.1 E3 ubiquitin-protein ligase APD2 [Cannabis sativa]XP_060957762.1 E3 ubiquitin-protein ligase APD2 [Cannabis sativa]